MATVFGAGPRVQQGDGLDGARWYDPAVGRWLSEDPSGLTVDADPYRYVGNAPTNAIDLSGLDEILLASALDAKKPSEFAVPPYREGRGRGIARRKGDVAKKTTKDGLFLEFVPNPKTNTTECHVFGWIQHVIHFDRDSSKKMIYSQTPTYDNNTKGGVTASKGANSDPAGPQPNESDRPADGKWGNNPWYGGPGTPDGMVPAGHSPENPQPQPSMYDRPGSDITLGPTEEYIAELVCTTKQGATPIFAYYYYLDNGDFHGAKISLEGLGKIKVGTAAGAP